jgi:DNA-binding CsgD family transcriptional regulator
MRGKSCDDVIDQLYEAATTPRLMQPALEDLCRWLQCDSFHLIGWDEARHEPTINVVSAKLAGAEVDYSRYFHLIDPRRPYVEKAQEGRIYACQDVFDKRYVSGSEFYQDFLQKYDARYGMGTCLHKDGATYINLALNRTQAQGSFTADHMSMASRVSPHLRRAMKAAIRLDSVFAALECGNRALDALAQAVLLVDASLRIKAANGLAIEALGLAELMRDVAGYLMRGRSCSMDLAELVREVVRSGRAESRVACYKQGEGFAKNQITVTKMSGRGLSQYYLVSMKSIEAHKPLPARHLAGLYGLTPAEAALAAFVSGGGSVPRYAAERGISLATARTHMRRILEKTGVQGLQSLVAVLASLPRPMA